MTQVVEPGTTVGQNADLAEDRFASIVEIADAAIGEHIKEHGRLTRWDYAEILHRHPELTSDDLDIQVARLSEAGKLKQTTAGLVAV